MSSEWFFDSHDELSSTDLKIDYYVSFKAKLLCLKGG
jgi:hypothetical protein